MFLAVGNDGHARFVIAHAVDGGIAAQFLIDAGHVQRALTGHGKDGHVLAFDQVFLKQFHHGAGIAALDHDAHLLALEGRQIGGGIVDVEGTPDQLVHIFGRAHEERHGMGGVVALLPADDAVQFRQLGLDGGLEIVQSGVLPRAERAQGGQGHVRDLEQRFGVFQTGRGAQLVDAIRKGRDHMLPALAFGGRHPGVLEAAVVDAQHGKELLEHFQAATGDSRTRARRRRR